MMTFYNTINVRGQELAIFEAEADKQEVAIKAVFVDNPGAEITPEDILSNHPAFRLTPITSIRRAFTNLKNEGVIEKTDNQIKGMYGKPIYTWKLIPYTLGDVLREYIKSSTDRQEAHKTL